MRIVTLMTCHNRKAKTLACLDALFQNLLPKGYSLDVFLVDDGSTDGTEQAVCEGYPQVNIIKGDGNLYWNGGMRVAFAAALGKDFDYYLWLNDDTMLYPHAIATLLNTEEEVTAAIRPPAVVVGSTQDKQGGNVTYGGELRASEWHPIKYQLITPKDVPTPCDTMNGNCVLIPRDVARVLGNLDSSFVHTIGDIDYGLRARMAGFQVVVMPGYAGICGRNPILNSIADHRLSRVKRLQIMAGKKGLPFYAWYVFTKRHCGAFWMIFWMWTYLRVIITPVGLSKNRRDSK